MEHRPILSLGEMVLSLYGDEKFSEIDLPHAYNRQGPKNTLRYTLIERCTNTTTCPIGLPQHLYGSTEALLSDIPSGGADRSWCSLQMDRSSQHGIHNSQCHTKGTTPVVCWTWTVGNGCQWRYISVCVRGLLHFPHKKWCLAYTNCSLLPIKLGSVPERRANG